MPSGGEALHDGSQCRLRHLLTGQHLAVEMATGELSLSLEYAAPEAVWCIEVYPPGAPMVVGAHIMLHTEQPAWYLAAGGPQPGSEALGARGAPRRSERHTFEVTLCFPLLVTRPALALVASMLFTTSSLDLHPIMSTISDIPPRYSAQSQRQCRVS